MKRIWMLCMACYVPTASAGDWSSQAMLQSSYTTYQGSDSRNSATSAGVIGAVNYLDDGGLTLAVNQLQLDMASGHPIRQDSYFISGRYQQYLDVLPGKLTYQLNLHQDTLSNDLGYRGKATVVAPQLSYTNYRNTLYMDIGYAYSSYQEGFSVQQWTPTLGFAMNQGADWLQSRVYAIQSSQPKLTQGQAQTLAAELKWIHWFSPSAWFNKATLGVLWGDRMLAVDGDAAAVYTLADLQQGGATLGIEADLFAGMKSSLVVGYDSYVNQWTKDAYTAKYVYLNINQSW